MTRQLDPTILRFFTVSRIISPASEMCLCKFHIKIEYFLNHRHPPCAQTLSALRFLPRHQQNNFPSPTIIHFPHHPTLLSTRSFKSQLFTVSHICVRIFCDSTTPPKRRQKPALSHTFLTPFCARTLICTTDFPCFLSFSFYLHICLCIVLYFKVFSKCPIHSFIFFHMVFRIPSFTNPIYGLGWFQNGFHRRNRDCEV